jgi:hypothetical protein
MMRRLARLAALGVLFCAEGSAAGQADCQDRAQSVAAKLSMAREAKEPQGAVAMAFQEAEQDLKDCPQDETLWYLLLRAAEQGGSPFAATVDGIQIDDLKSAADSLAQRFPHSARIATVRARALSTVEAAKQAVALDPSYAPAHVALGAAKLRTGDAAGARAALENVHELGRVPGGYVLLARARLALGDADGAVAAAAKEPSPRQLNPIELGARDERPAREAREIMGLAHLAAKRFDKAARLLLEAAAGGSASARGTLEQADANLRAALGRLRHSKRLTPEEKSVLADVLKLKTPPPAKRSDAGGIGRAGGAAASQSTRWVRAQRGF